MQTHADGHQEQLEAMSFDAQRFWCRQISKEAAPILHRAGNTNKGKESRGTRLRTSGTLLCDSLNFPRQHRQIFNK